METELTTQEVDRRLAELAGWKVWTEVLRGHFYWHTKSPDGREHYWWNEAEALRNIPAYCTDAAATMGLLEEVMDRDWRVDSIGKSVNGRYIIMGKMFGPRYTGIAPTLTEAIARCLLAVLEAEKEGKP